VFVPVSARYVLWAVAVVVDASGPVLATLRGNNVPLHMEHLPERFGLFVILVLGEMVAGVVTGVHDAEWAGPAVTVGAIGFIVAAALWWSYFDVTSAGGTRELQDEQDEGGETDERHDLFIYGHLPLTLGVVAAGVGLEELVLHPDAALPSPGGWTAAAGVGLFLAGAGVILAGAHRRLNAMWPWPTAALVPVVVFGFLPVPPVVLTALLALTAIMVAVVGAQRAVRDRWTESPVD
jgi:low temperature requirement protein LtrA